jgi:hypothetical protein
MRGYSMLQTLWATIRQGKIELLESTELAQQLED